LYYGYLIKSVGGFWNFRKNSLTGEKACAYVVAKPGQTFTFEEMIAFLDGKQVAKYKLQERLEIINQLPLLPGGVSKVDKKVLVKDIADKVKVEGR
jgi:non-ribosomal peptide synthetase component E (peptide arylation enzyme)